MRAGDGSDPILSAVGRIFQHRGAVVEQSGEKLEVLLDERQSRQLSLPEEVALSTRADIPGTRYCGLGAEVLDRLESWMGEEGACAGLELDRRDKEKSAGFERLLAERIGTMNATLRLQSVHPRLCPYLLWELHYTGQADEKRQGSLRFWMNAMTGATETGPGPALEWPGARRPVSGPPPSGALIERTLMEAILDRIGRRLVGEHLGDWNQALARRRDRDLRRLQEYYGGMRAAIENRLGAKAIQEAERGRIRAVEEELQAKRADTIERFRLRIAIVPHNVTRIDLPVIGLLCRVHRRKATRDIQVIYNPWSHALEPLRCEVSHDPMTRFWVRDGDMKLVCREELLG